MYKINWKPACDDLQRLDKEVALRIVKKVGSIASNPFHFVEHLEGFPLYKLRIGDYRAILDIKQKELQIVVVFVDHRSRIYKKLSRTL